MKPHRRVLSFVLLALISILSCARERKADPVQEKQVAAERDVAPGAQVLSRLRTRFAVEATESLANPSDHDSADGKPESLLLAAVAEKFDSEASGFRPLFASAPSIHAARVRLPSLSTGPFELEDVSSGIRLEVVLQDARDVAAESAEGYLSHELVEPAVLVAHALAGRAPYRQPTRFVSSTMSS